MPLTNHLSSLGPIVRSAANSLHTLAGAFQDAFTVEDPLVTQARQRLGEDDGNAPVPPHRPSAIHRYAIAYPHQSNPFSSTAPKLLPTRFQDPYTPSYPKP